MNNFQIEYYNSLSEKGKHILNVAALKGFAISVSSISQLVNVQMQITQNEIIPCLDSALKAGLFSSSHRFSREYEVNPSFIVYVYPLLKDYSEEWKLINGQTHYYYGNPQIKYFKNFVYNLLFNGSKLLVAQEELLQYAFYAYADELAVMLDNTSYQTVLPQLHPSILNQLFISKIQLTLLNLDSMSDLKLYVDKLKSKSSVDYSEVVNLIDTHYNLHTGHFTSAQTNAQGQFSQNYNISAIDSFLKGDNKLALNLFELGLKELRKSTKGAMLPQIPHTAFFYVTLLLSMSPEATSPIFQKINNYLNKTTEHTSFTVLFRTVAHYALNEKQQLASSISYLTRNVYTTEQNYLSLISFLLMYLVDVKPKLSVLSGVIQTVKRAYSNGYYVLAYEAAYALKQWTDEREVRDLYAKIATHFDYEPALSHISRQEDWEKSLNTFLSIGGKGKTSLSDKEDTGKYRVVYYVNFNNGFIQPVLQSRNAKGLWSTGRNIALKTFSKGTVEGMTEQDVRISKNVKASSSYYGSEDYYFKEGTIKDLVGHPFVFLNGSTDVVVELVTSQPVLEVKKKAKGYTLTTDIKDVTEKLIVEKETNTRYKIYDLTAQQVIIIKAIQEQKIIVPDQGKDKLMQVLGNFSSHLTVHSDLLATDNAKVKKVTADNRLRVQLLPLGEGLKAEIFAKPFGTHPPYCKPGKGGKTLIANEKGEQLQVTRNLLQETEIAEMLLGKIQALESIDMSDDLISFDDPMDSLHLLDILAANTDKCVVEWPEGERFKIKGSVSFGNLNLRIKSKSNWFELQGELKVDENTVLTIQQLLELTAKGHNRFVELKQGEFLALSDKLKKQLDELRTFSTAGKEGLQINKFASVALGDFFDDVENLKTDKAWKEFRQRVDVVQNTETQIPSNLQAELRPYQEEGFRWLSRLAEWEGGACLADDMGLGKTVQTLAVLLHRAQSGAALVICPVSVIPNWISETAKFAPTLNVKTLTSGNREQTLQNLEAGDLLVTSYGLLQSEESAFANIQFATIVLDEAHTIKNYATKTSKAAMQLQAPFRMALTGTPIQNHLGEVWNLFNFINPGLLGSLSHFTDTFIKSDNEHARKHLKKLIAPFILRRTKSAVLDELPPKTEIIKKVQLSVEEMAYYEALRRQAIANLESDDSPQGSKQLKALAEITRLRQACCNPALVDPTLNIGSSKLSMFLEIVAELIENKHRALVFSQFVKHLTLVRAALDKLGMKYQYLDGSSPMNEREQSVKKFQSGEGDLFLISLKAGGLGLNLTAADYVIHMDPWWNPAIEDQASDRAHRYGQLRPVTIYRLVAENTIEEKIIQLHNTKRDLADSLLEGSDQSAKMSITELVSLIKDRD
ncbi:MAG TPA: DEAD/DEAH box helicase [Paludibacter sp.]